MQSNLTPESLADQADTLAKSGDLAGAIAHLKQAVKVQPYFMSGWMRLSQILFETDHFKEAVQVTQAAERFDPLAEDFAQIQSAMQSQQFAKAEHAAQQMLIKQPGHPRAAFTLAHLAGAKNNPENKVKALQLGLSHFPASLVLRHMLIGASEEAGDYAGAIKAARILVQTEESFPSLWALITVLLRYGLNEELLEVCDRACDVAGSDPKKLSEIELVRGQTLRVMGQREDSIAAYRKCLAHNRENAGAWWALADMKNFEFSDVDSDAIRALIDTRPQSDPDRCIATFALAKAAESAGDWDTC
ncbi:MAG: tetratricopeptide repeat protein, partial [Pseudomonadota bacterium]